jgi:hypothetical protein
MKRLVNFCAVVSLALLLIPAAHAQSGQVIPGTQVRLTLVNGLSTTVAREGDPFTATVAEPVFVGNELVLPAGAIVHGTVSSVERPKLFAMFRGGASMNINFSSIEVASRIFPARMSILSIYSGSIDTRKERKDVKTVEGVVVEQNNKDIKGDIEDVALGTAGGSVVGLVFSRVVRGTVIGLVGGSAYVVAKKGKEVDLPAQTGMLVRMDTTLSLPASLMHNASYTSGGN